MKPEGRRPRSDALRNRDRVLAAAEQALASAGADVPLDEIARRAGVGAGTVYRHFPSKDALIEAVVASRMARMAAAARSFAERDDAGSAFFSFFAQAVDWIAVNKTLVAALGRPTGIRAVPQSKREFQAALSELRARAQQAGAIRADVDDDDVVALLAGCVAMVSARGSADRMVALACAALAPTVAGELPPVTKAGAEGEASNVSQRSGRNENMHRPSEHCAVCGTSLPVPARGRPRRFCGDACRQTAHRQRARARTDPARTPPSPAAATRPAVAR
jgi:AcrR family transcriptional regulator/predicted nucleic acid-binding Zn ribbon protein